MASLLKPKAGSVASMLAMLFGVDELEVGDGDASLPSSAIGASYVDDEGVLVAMLVADYSFAAFSGAALSMIPKGGAEDMAKDEDLSEGVRANFYEVANICSRLLMNDQSTHIKLAELVEGAALADAVGTLEGSAVIGFTVPIPRYGNGKLYFVVS